MHVSAQSRRLVLLALLALVVPVLSLAAAAQDSLAPDLHHGGANPSSIPNHETTKVTLPGLHLTGATVTVTGVCRLGSYKVISDAEIDLVLTGNRTVDDKDDGCFLTVHKGAKQAGTYVVVELTDAEAAQQNTVQAAVAMTKANAYMAALGTAWTLHYADGASEVFTAQPADLGQLPEFTSPSGGSVKIMLSGPSVVIVADSCMLSGTLANNQVKDGKSQGSCKHSGAWTATKK